MSACDKNQYLQTFEALGGSHSAHLQNVGSLNTSLWNGRVRASVPNPCWVSATTKLAPEKHYSPQGLVAHFFKESKKLFCLVKVFLFIVPPICVQAVLQQRIPWLLTTKQKLTDHRHVSHMCCCTCWRSDWPSSPLIAIGWQRGRDI